MSSNLEKYFIPTPYFSFEFEEFLKSIRDTINFEKEKEIRIKCRDFIAQLIYQLRQRLPKNFLQLKNTCFFSVENSLMINKPKLYDNFKEDMKKFNMEHLTALEQQW